MSKNNDIYTRSLELHKKLQGKMSTETKVAIETYEDLALLYSPGVARASEEIFKDPENVYKYTSKSNTVAIISDGSAVLGLGNIGAKAALPVMEGKAALFKRFGNVNAVPIVLDTQDPDEIINICKNLAPGFGGINLEDISSPNCVYIETKLQDLVDIPVFHDDQHGTSIVTTAALINALRLVDKKPEDIKLVISGAGAAGFAIIKLIRELGVKNIYAFNSQGIINKDKKKADLVYQQIQKLTNLDNLDQSLEETIKDADVFIGVSVGGLVSSKMVKSMAKDSIVFAMANPTPEIDYDTAINAGARVVGTGRSDYPNQINNIIVFPGLFKGLLKVRAKRVVDQLKLHLAFAIADIVKDDLSEVNIIPKVFDERVVETIVKSIESEILKLRKEGLDV